MAAKPVRDTLIHCEACGEDYSSTYRRCPFCGARNDPRRNSGRDDPKSSARYIPTPPPAKPPAKRSDEQELDDTYVFDGQGAFDEEPEEENYAPRPKGGKRLAPKEGGSFDLPPVNWPRLITFLCSLVIIVAALIIVFTFIYPKLHDGNEPGPAGSEEVASTAPSVAPSPVNSLEPDPADSTEPIPVSEPVDITTPPPAQSAPAVTQPPSTGQAATVVNASGGLRVRSGPGTTYEVLGSLSNGDPINVLSPAGSGWYNISYTGRNGTTVTGCIMGDYISTISGTAATPAPATQPPVIASQSPGASGNPAAGQAGTIVNAAGGLRVRSGPGTTYEVQDTLLNGNPITVIAPADNGWYNISYIGRGGVTMSGYIMGEYISTN